MGFFKAYDMRGTFGVDFNLETVYRVGLQLPQVVTGRRWLVGRDCRASSAAVRDALVAGLVASGAEVTDLGLCTTPMVYHFTAEDDYDGSVMITASHNPPGDNGLKVSRRGALPVGYADGLDRVERMVAAETRSYRPGGDLSSIKTVGEESLARYLAFMGRVGARGELSTSDAGLWPRTVDEGLSTLQFAVDCSNGMASLLAKDLFPGSVMINDTLDGRFPNHSPNPLKSEAREQIAALVREKGLDCGVIFDGDADRCMFVDERGEFVQPDYLIPIVARATLSSCATAQPPVSTPKIIHDVRTSRGAIEAIRAMGCEPVMVPVGHAFAKPALRESGAVCGGELAGHYYFGDFHCCDSGILAALRILSEIARAKAAGRSFSEMMRPICGAYANSGEINFRVADKDAAIARVLACVAKDFPPERSRSEIDGMRIEFDAGWINVRKSNTEPYLRLIAERRSEVNAWVDLLKGAIEHDC